MTPEESMFTAVADMLNSIDRSESYSVGAANGYLVLYREVGRYERYPYMEVVFDETHDHWTVRRV